MSEKENKAVDMIVRLDVNDFKGNLLERWKATVTDKRIGRRIILRLKSIFSLTLKDITEEEDLEFQDELARQKELSKIA